MRTCCFMRGREGHFMRFMGALADLCMDRILWRRCGIRGPLGNYDGAVASAARLMAFLHGCS